MQTCPKCGHKFAEPDNGLLSPRIARKAIEALGGAESVGETLADQIEKAEDGSHRKMQLMSQLKGWVEISDRSQQASKEMVRGISEDQMKPILLEYAMQLLETDPEFQEKVVRVATKRGLIEKIPLKVIEAEGVLVANE